MLYVLLVHLRACEDGRFSDVDPPKHHDIMSEKSIESGCEAYAF